MADQLKLSIITVCLNNKEGLVKTLESIACQKERSFEWIVVDGGSTDGSLELIKGNEHLIASWSSEPDKNLYDGMNKGIRKAHGEYLLFLNSGDYLYDEQVVGQVLPRLEGKDFYIGNMYKSDSIGVDGVTANGLQPKRLLYRLLMSSLTHPSSFIRKDVFTRYGYYRDDVKIVADWHLFFSTIVLRNASVGYLPVVVSVFDVSGISSTNRGATQAEREMLLKENPYIEELATFYLQNKELVTAVRESRLMCAVVRAYYYFYRKKK